MYYYDVYNNKWILLRDTAEYKKRRRILRTCWIIVALIMTAIPLPVTIIIALAATFLSFMFLDESKYAFMLANEPTRS